MKNALTIAQTLNVSRETQVNDQPERWGYFLAYMAFVLVFVFFCPLFTVATLLMRFGLLPH